MNERGSLDFLAAAVEVLREAGRPMTSREITSIALRKGILVTRGKTPKNSMDGRLYAATREDPDCPIVRLYEPGAQRARRGSVRWTLRE